MTDVKHTAGPWSISGAGPKSRTIYRATDTTTYPVADVTADNLNRYGAGDLDANAALIAAAPDLLREAEWCVALLKSRTLNDDERAVLDAMEAAIAKARGAA